MNAKSIPKLAIAAILMTLAFAGCLSPEKSTTYHAYATGGKAAIGFAYNGAGVQASGLDLFIDVNDAANTGILYAKPKSGGNMTIMFDQFMATPGKAFHDGGIAANFWEHGDTGVGDTSIPKVDLEMAGWGTANITLGGKNINDPISGADRWNAHFMVIRNGVRDNTTGAIWANASKKAPYDPKTPGAGYSEPGDYEVHLILRSAEANSTKTAVGPIAPTNPQPSAQYAASHGPIKVTVPFSTVQLTYTITGQAFVASNLTFRAQLAGTNVPGGNRAVGTTTMAPISQSTSMAGTVRFMAPAAGDYTVSVTGRLAPGNTYNIAGEISTPEGAIVQYYWWEDVVLGDEAAGLGTTLMGGAHAH